jgi:hypothetical protein
VITDLAHRFLLSFFTDDQVDHKSITHLHLHTSINNHNKPEMARRSANPTIPAPYKSQLGAGRRLQADMDESSFSRFLREQIYAPEKLPGNISVLTGVGLFFGGVVAVRAWGDLLIPA